MLGYCTLVVRAAFRLPLWRLLERFRTGTIRKTQQAAVMHDRKVILSAVRDGVSKGRVFRFTTSIQAHTFADTEKQLEISRASIMALNP